MSVSPQVTEVHDDKGRLTGRFEMADGKLHGLATLYDAGRMLAEIRYVAGVRHGEMRSYSDSGTLSSIVAHADDVPHGAASYYHPDGALARSAHYKHGRLHGEVRDYAADGKLISSATYIDGKAPAALTIAAAAAAPAVAVRKSWLTKLVEG